MKTTTTTKATETLTVRTTLDGDRAVPVIYSAPNGAKVALDKMYCGCDQSNPLFWTYPVYAPGATRGSLPETIEQSLAKARKMARASR